MARCGLLCLALATATSAPASPTSEPSARPHKVRVKQSRSPAEESSAERDRRLYRECAGRPNAGACLGYTQKPPQKP